MCHINYNVIQFPHFVMDLKYMVKSQYIENVQIDYNSQYYEGRYFNMETQLSYELVE